MSKVALKIVATQIRGVSYSPTDASETAQEDYVPLLRAHNIQDNGLNFDRLVYVKSGKIKATQYIKKGDIVVCASSGSKNLVGKAAQAKEDMTATFGAFCKVVRPSDTVHHEYIGQFFNSEIYRREISNSSEGVNINNIRNEHIDQISVLLPSIDTQHLIADTLCKIQVVIATRCEQLAVLDKLARDAFVDMFGDPVENPTGWDVVPFYDCVNKIDNGESPKCLSRKAELEEPAVLKLSAVTKGVYDDNENKAAPHIQLNPENEIKQGDLLMTRKNTHKLVGACAYVFATRGKLFLPDIVFRLCTTTKMSKLFLWQLMNFPSFRPRVRALAGGTAGSMPNISKGRLINLPIICPPLELQEEYGKTLLKINRQQSRLTESLGELDTMYKSTLYRVFNGELFQ